MHSDVLHPEIAPLIESFPAFNFTVEALPELRATMMANYKLMAAAPNEAVDSVDHDVDADLGVIVRIHTPKSFDPKKSDPRPCVFSIHGGGYIIGSRDMDDAQLGRWCSEHGCIGASVEYRLAPETPFPGPLDDCYAGLEWVVAHADELGIDPHKIGIFGVSAGGGLAAGLALLARERGEIPLRFQTLLMPMLDDRQHSPSSRRDDLVVWSKDSNEFGWRSYLGDLYGSDDVPPFAAAARCDDLAGLPPAFVAVGSVDGFRDEDIEYALRLNQAGVQTELHVYPGAPHGFQAFPNSSVAKQAQLDLDRWMATQIANLTSG